MTNSSVVLKLGKTESEVDKAAWALSDKLDFVRAVILDDHHVRLIHLTHNEICGWGQHGDVTRQVFTLVLLAGCFAIVKGLLSEPR